MPSKNNIPERVSKLEEHMIILNREFGEIRDSCKEIKTALIGDLDRPETMEKSIDKRIGKIEIAYKITTGIIVVVIPVLMWLVDKFW